MSHLDATAALLEVARDTLREEVAPGLGAEARYHAAMVANAMAIAIREVELGAADPRRGARAAGRTSSTAGATLPELRAPASASDALGRVLEER